MSTTCPTTYIPIVSDIVASVLRVLRSVTPSSHACRKRDLIQELTRRRVLFKGEILCRDSIIRQVSLLGRFFQVILSSKFSE